MIIKRWGTLLALAITLVTITGCGSGGGTGGGTYDSYVEDNQLSLQKVSISNSTTDSAEPAIAASSNGTVFIAWEEATSSEGKEIYLASSVNYGKTFFPLKGVSRMYCKNRLPVSEDISLRAGENGKLYLAWIDKMLDVAKVMFFSDPSCSTVSDTSLTTTSATHVSLSSNGEISVAWAGSNSGIKEVYYSRSVNGGGSFSKQFNISNTPDSDSSAPLLAIEGSYSVDKAVWVEGEKGNRKVVFSTSIDSSGEFLPFKIISSTSTDSHCPVITSSPSETYVAYKGDNKIHFTSWYPGTPPSFINPLDISGDSSSPSCPEITLSSDGTIYVVWSDMDSIWLTASHDGGINFALPKAIFSTAGTSSSPRIAALGSNVSVVWEGENGGNNDIFLSGSADNGKTFYLPKNLSNSSSPSLAPVIATDSKQFIYVAWEEGSEGSREIYFVKSAM